MIQAKAYDEKPTGLAGLVEALREKLQDSLFDKKTFTVLTQRTPGGYSSNITYDGIVVNIPTYVDEVFNIQKMNETFLETAPEKNGIESEFTKYKFRPSKLFR